MWCKQWGYFWTLKKSDFQSFPEKGISLIYQSSFVFIEDLSPPLAALATVMATGKVCIKFVLESFASLRNCLINYANFRETLKITFFNVQK